MAGRWGDWELSRPVLGLAGLMGVLLLLPLVGAFLAGGVGAALGLGMGYLASSRPAATMRWRLTLALSLGAAMAGAVAVALRGQPLAATFFVALCCLLAAPANQIQEGLMAGVPTVAAVLVAVPGTYEVGPTFAWMLAGSVVVVAVATRFLPRAAPGAPVDTERGWRHAGVMAVTVGVVVFLVLRFDVPHGYWIALTLTVVLRPFGDVTRRKALERVAGTIAGVALSLVLATVLPIWGVAIAVAFCMVLMAAYALKGDYVRQVVFLTPTVVLMGSWGTVGLVGLERALATVAGAVLAALVGGSLALYDARAEDRA